MNIYRTILNKIKEIVNEDDVKSEVKNETSTKKHLIDTESKPENIKLFFGDYGNYIRIDKINYLNIRKLFEHSQGNTWFMDEISYSDDIKGFSELDEKTQRIFKLNIVYQTLMDSGTTNIFDEISKVASVSELQYLYKRISIEESIHSLTYSTGLSTVFGEKATEILDLIYNDKVVQKRLEQEIDYSEQFIDICINQGRTDLEAKKALLQLLISIFLLEGIKFPFSFLITWLINKPNNSIQGFSRAIKLIAHDELTTHTVTGKTVINLLRNKKEGFSELFENGWFEEQTIKMAKKIVEQELEWNKYLLKDGSIEGYTEGVGENFIKYFADLRLQELKLEPIYNESKSDTVKWFMEYRNLNNGNTALQEAEATNYSKGMLKNDLSKFDSLKEKK